ncbi:MAG: fumarylacetoacetate hydrolase family protein [Rhodospirillales bacterium]|jgi:2-keto-4-pentenoate hydratase/2-oxohepta-3-ene-1,7-dioic acid hydratase in catechol pathway|nr:fumarylacetoacetate hydrolase [Rhodospirillaceae bacterium]MDP6430284.1 fumarylacetoacetate hydrolase family protein [Rhodospirillales bacterium]MDP6643909.1 fumarylacetoacetate hydrolase family protein [Rhodospirillales bacterium]MDP6841343.1 fumarylacetoacetate hydrolase family protein [Rhodospirillales bacterium]
MKLVLFSQAGGAVAPGLLTGRGVVSIAGAVPADGAAAPMDTMRGIIDGWDRLKPALQDLEANGEALDLAAVKLHPPLPRPGKMLCCIGNYWEHAERQPRPLNMFLKNPDAVIGPGDTVVLPEFTEPWVFHHEAELAIVIKGPAKNVAPQNWRDAVFGYTCMIDVSARGEARSTWRRGSWMGKSFDTFGPLGPCIATADELRNPNDLHVRLWCSGELRHDYNTNDMEHAVPELIEHASMIMTLNSGDTIACGTNHEGLGALQDGDNAVIEIESIGRMEVHVSDPLKRVWQRGVYMGENSTNLAAVAAAEANTGAKEKS